MKKTRRSQTDSALLRYGFAVVVVVLVTLMRWPLNPLLGVSAVPFILYFPAIMISGWYGRLGPGVLATALSTLAALYFNIEPSFALTAPTLNDAFRLGLFFIEGVFMSVITEAWHRSKEALTRSKDLEGEQREWLQVTLSSIGDAVIATDSDGRISFVNPVAQSLTGWKQEEAAGKPIETVFKIVNESTRVPVESPVMKVMQDGTVVGLANHTVLIRKDGTEIPIDDSGAPIRDGEGNIKGVVLVFRDISERKRAEEAVRKSEERFAMAFNAVPIPISISHIKDARIVAVNEAFLRTSGYSREEVIGRTADEINLWLDPADRDRMTGLFMQQKKIRDQEIRFRSKSGQLRTYLMSAELIEFGGEPCVLSAANDIHDRKIAEERIAFAASIVESSDDTIIGKTLDGTIVSWNAGAEKMYGYSADEVIGRHISILAPNEQRAEIAQILERLSRGESVYHLETVRVRKDGNKINVSLSISPIKDHNGNVVAASTIARDITDRKRSEVAQEFLAEASSVFASSLDYETTLASVARLTVPRLADWCGVEIVEEDGRTRQLAVAHKDPAKIEFARELSRRYPPDPNAPTGVPNVLRTGKSEFYSEITDEMLTAAAQDEEHLELIRDLGMRSAMIVPLIARGRAHGAIIMVAAESERRYDKLDLALAEDLARRAAFAVDNARLYREAQRARAEAEEANRAKDEFLATVSHELRTPLNAIVGWTHMLRHNKFDEPTTERAMETIERNARSQARLIEDILDVSRIITGKLRLDVHPIELSPVIEAAVDAVRPAADAKEIRMQVILDPRAGPVSGDPSRLQQVVWNLVSNAVKFTSRGGRIQVRLERVNSNIEIIVSDTGQGIVAGLMPHIFERFRQGDSSTTRTHGGLGLGLAIVRHLVELHGGTVQAWSPGAGQGATFTVKLPLLVWHRDVKEGERAHPAASGRMALGGAPSLDGLRVLVVDDEPDTREMLKLMIEQFGAEVKVSASALEALDQLEQWKPNVLVSDIEMPGEDGYNLIQKIRALEPERGGTIAAVALTAYARTEDRMRSLAAGYHMHMAKPAEPVELAIVIGNLAGQGGKGRAR